jgi:hypothetical protein
LDEEEKLLSRGLDKENQPLKYLDKVIEEITRLMVRSAKEEINKGKMNRGEPTITTGNK